jgi:hypothetical protein
MKPEKPKPKRADPRERSVTRAPCDRMIRSGVTVRK